ncbi:MAG: hypothetical protein FWH57_00635 [Oscillospiraceae bacterium]|nr:hypothetical protein [Oscillospiraceae bacterium]
MSELERLRQIHRKLGDVITQMEAEQRISPSVVTRTIRLGDARSMAVLTSIANAGGAVLVTEFETILAQNGRSLRGAGGFLGGAGASVRREGGTMRITDAGTASLEKWKTRYGDKWMEGLVPPETLADRSFPDSSRIPFAP